MLIVQLAGERLAPQVALLPKPCGGLGLAGNAQNAMLEAR